MADYDVESQTAFVDICSIEGYQINKSTMQYIVRACPPPAAQKQLVLPHGGRHGPRKRKTESSAEEDHFDRRSLPPIWTRLGSDQELETLFLAFLRERVK